MKILRLGKIGFAHHLILMLLVVVGVAGFGGYSVLKANADSYDAHVTIRTSGNDGHTVYFKTITHTLGLCNPHFETISTASSKTCDGSSMGTPNGLNVYVSSVPAGYKLTGWTVTSSRTNGSVSCITTNCRISFDNGSAIITANFERDSTPPPTQSTDSYLTLNTAGNDGHSATFKTTYHSLGSCNPHMEQFTVATTRLCQGFSMGYPDHLLLSVAKAPTGYSFTGWSVGSQNIVSGSRVTCNTSCTVNFGQGSATLTANFKKDTAATKPQKILVIGDSITAFYTNEAKYGQGWWKYLAQNTGVPVVLSAEPGSGYVRTGNDCNGTTFSQRLGDVTRNKPTYIIVEGGRNDANYCNSQKKYTRASDSRIQHDVSSYLNQLVKTAAAAGVPRGNIYAFTPWGSSYPDQRAQVVPIIKQNAARYGIHYIDMPAYPRSLTIDGTHPTPAGSQYIYSELAKLSNLDSIRN